MFVHTVFFWAKKDATALAVEQLERDIKSLLGDIASVKHLWTGTPAPIERPVVDGSYTVALTVLFQDKAAHDLYQVDPLHLKFLERNKHTWERVQIYDFSE